MRVRQDLKTEEVYLRCDYCGAKNIQNPIKDERDELLDFCDENCKLKHRDLFTYRGNVAKKG